MKSHQFGAGSNLGNIRDNNEDSYVCQPEKELWIVADGMGGLGFGEAASAITVYTLATMINHGHGVNHAIEEAHKNIKTYAVNEAMGTNMGTTLVLLLCQGNIYNLFWVGDSRGYLYDTRLVQVTRDHSLINSLIEQGELTEEEALYDPRKSAITKALGVQELESVRADSISERWKAGQKLLLCSDGLTDCVDDQEIETIMQAGGTDQEIVDRLIEAALENGGKDNVTVIIVSAPDDIFANDVDTEYPDEEAGEEAEETQQATTRQNAPDDDQTQMADAVPDAMAATFVPEAETEVPHQYALNYEDTAVGGGPPVERQSPEAIARKREKDIWIRYFIAIAAGLLLLTALAFLPDAEGSMRGPEAVPAGERLEGSRDTHAPLRRPFVTVIAPTAQL